MNDCRPGPVIQGKEMECLPDAPILEVNACAMSFELPKNFKDLSDKEKEEVCKKLAKHNATEKERETAESNPSTILFDKPNGYQEFLAIKKLRLSMRKDEGEPIIVAKETPEMFAQTLDARRPVSSPPPISSEGGSSDDCETLEI